MTKEEIEDYLKRVDELGAKLIGEDKETYAWLIYGCNQFAKLLNEKEQQYQKQKEYNQHLHNLNNTIFRELLDKKYENKKQKEVINKAIELLGNYKHYSTPDEKQNSENEDLVNNAFDILKEVSE